jgi:ABC-type transporter Mla MlaB component
VNTVKTDNKLNLAADSPQRAVIALNGSQDVRAAAEFQKTLLEHFAQEQTLTIDCSAIESLDAAFLQLLVAAKRERPQQLSIDAPVGSEAERWIQYSGLSNLLLSGATSANIP